jgi:hypothetical protein
MQLCLQLWQDISTDNTSAQEDNVVLDKLIVGGVERVVTNKSVIAPLVLAWLVVKNILSIYKYPI